jgi:hypothetical protein
LARRVDARDDIADIGRLFRNDGHRSLSSVRDCDQK